MNLRVITSVALMLAVTSLYSCKKEKQSIYPPTNVVGNVNVNFDYVFGHNLLPWTIGTQYVHPMTGDTMTFTTFKFYVSNIKFKDSKGNWWSEPNSYHLVCNTCPEKANIKINNVPGGDYVEMQYTMGIDSAMNVSGVYNGDLTLGNGMFWDWNSGFIMLKAEGNSPNSTTGVFAFHLGGFTGSDNIVTIKNTNFDGKTMAITNTKDAAVTLRVNPARLWHSVDGLSVRSTVHMPGPIAKTMATDFYSNISFLGLSYQ
ncbi:MAG: hypothetical protein H6551_07355 [Chitinophagales bacterium]|nr:hypothetical protein [Chitinophagaceae bacterium]MCB9064946.1 hypothetical protein [Chitinophagales bacterium]